MPDAGEQVAPDSDITVYVASDKVFVESFVGQNVDDATARLQQLGFTVRTKQVPNAAPAGTVVDQSPRGVAAKRGTTVTLSVSTGVAPTTAPPTTTEPSPTISESPSPTGSTSPTL